MSVRYKREPPGRLHPSMRDVYPTASAKAARVRRLGPPPRSAEDGYPREIRCAQCGYPIADFMTISECPLCGSNNFVGIRHGKVQQ